MLLSLLLALTACDSGTPSTSAAPAADATASTAPAETSIRGTVEEVIAAGPYTYLRVKPAKGAEIWAAIAGSAPAVGASVTIATTLPMRDFRSEILDRTFPLVYFVQSLDGSEPAAAAATEPSAMPADHGAAAADAAAPAAPTLTPVEVSGPPAGKKKVAEVYAERATLKGREVTLTVKVTKSTSGVLGRNWLHVQDGSGAEGTNDLTVTTKDAAEIGDEITAKGIVALDQDLGSGYTYPVLITDASVTVTKAAAPAAK